MGMAAILVMWSRPFEQFFFPKGPGSCIWNLVTIGPVVSEEKSFEIVDGQTTEPAYTISSPGAFGSGELKNKIRQNKASQAIQSPRTVLFFLLIWLLDEYSFANVHVKGFVAFKH